MRQIIPILVLLGVTSTSFCAGKPIPVATRVPVAVVAPSAVASTPSVPTATIRAGDTFDMRLTGVPIDVIQDIANLQYTVGPDGIVNIPLIGKMKVSGMNSTQVEDMIQAKYIAEKIFTRPTVIISVGQVARFVSISGAVRSPQRLPWTADITLASAIGNCQGLGDFAKPKGITVIRDGKVFGTYNYKEITKNPASDPKLLPGDQVNVPE